MCRSLNTHSWFRNKSSNMAIIKIAKASFKNSWSRKSESLIWWTRFCRHNLTSRGRTSPFVGSWMWFWVLFDLECLTSFFYWYCCSVHESWIMTVNMWSENKCFKRLWSTVSNESLSLVKRRSFYCWIRRRNIQTLIDTEEKHSNDRINRINNAFFKRLVLIFLLRRF